MSSDASTGYSHQTVPQYPRTSSSACLHCERTILILLPTRLSSTHLLILVAPKLLGVFPSAHTCGSRQGLSWAYILHSACTCCHFF